MTDSTHNSRPVDVSAAMRQVFGFHSFRPNQEQIVRAAIDGRDVFAVMPTGGGKSLCYQLPAHLLAGTCVVVSPLISLMKDQVDAANENGLRAEYLNSSLDSAQQSAVSARLAGGELDLLYVAPERFARRDFLISLQTVRLSLFAIDEAHCISQWGHDFRPDYLKLSSTLSTFPDTPIAAFTATATPRVQQDIIKRLGLREQLTVRASFDRPNLFLQVDPKDGLDSQLLAFVRKHPGESGIIYRTTRNDVESTAASLVRAGINALPYHAGMDSDTRQRNQDAFNRSETDVIVATIAFGMGIDKSNVRFVLHGDLPKNMEGYYQEIGRAGRDGEPAHCTLFFSYGDITTIRYFISNMESEDERISAELKLNKMVNFASSAVCRRKQILAYFDEVYEEDNCGCCDICTGDVEHVDATQEARMLMSAIARTGQRFGAGHIVDIVTGANTKKIRELGHDSLKTYGAGAGIGKTKRHWRNIMDNLVTQGCLLLAGGEYPTLMISKKGGEVLFGRTSFQMFQKKADPIKASSKTRQPRGDVVTNYDYDLFEQLRSVRTSLAREQNVPPFVVFSDRTLREMARDMPTTPDEMREITGVGEHKLAQYSEDFLPVIRDYRKD